jgi:hypothetical protein
VRKGRDVFPWLGPHPLGWGVQGYQLRVGRLDGQKSPVEDVVLAIRDFRLGFHIVEVIVPLQSLPKKLQLGLGMGPGKGR